MKPKFMIILILISFSLEFSSNAFIRKLNEDSANIDTIEPETITTESYIFPHHNGESDSASDTYIFPHHRGESDYADSDLSNIPFHERESDNIDTSKGIITIPTHSISSTDTTTAIPFTNPAIPSHHGLYDTVTEEPINSFNGTITTIPSIISQPVYNSNLDRMTLLLIEIGYYRGPFPIISNILFIRYTFIVYYIKINYFYPLPIYMTMIIKVGYTYRTRGLFRALEDGTEDIIAECTRITYDDDINVRYNCTFILESNKTIDKITSNGNFTFEGLEGELSPIIVFTTSANHTLMENGIQSITGDEILENNKNIYILNNTILEENGLRFKLTGESSIPINDNKAILSFDENGNGEIKNATCDVNEIEGNIYELDCVTSVTINAELNGVSGITANTQEKIIIVMKPDSDSVLNADSKNNYVGYYSKKSSSGLSGGAIAGIVIACIVVLFAIAIACILCRKERIPAPFQESTLGINISNISSNKD